MDRQRWDRKVERILDRQDHHNRYRRADSVGLTGLSHFHPMTLALVATVDGRVMASAALRYVLGKLNLPRQLLGLRTIIHAPGIRRAGVRIHSHGKIQ